jgi:hypothetical protein
MGERKARGALRENSSARPSGALPNAVQDRHLGGENGVRDFFRARFSSTPQNPAQNRVVVPSSSRQ